MRKLYSIFVIALLMPIFAVAADYCAPYLSSYYGSYADNHYQYTAGGYASRQLYALTVSDNHGSEATISGLLSERLTNQNPGAAFNWCYKDKTSTILQTPAGSTLTLTVDGADHWICQYFYIDFDNDGTFDVDTEKAEINGDLVAHTGYDPSGADPTVDSDGNAVVYGIQDRTDSNTTLPLPSVTLPANMKPGTYRARFKMQWNNSDPCATCKDQEFLGCIDFTIEVTEAVSRIVSVESANNAYGTVAIEGTEDTIVETAENVTVVATPAEGYAFMNWTANGEVVSTDATYTYTGADDIELIAHFGYAVTIETVEGGTIVVVDGENHAIANGAVVAPGTQLTINASATGDYRLLGVTVNGETVENNSTVEVNSAVTISATFSNAPFVVKINVTGTGNGEVKVSSDVDTNDNPIGTIYTNDSPIARNASGYVFVIPDADSQIESVVIKGDGDEEFRYDNGDMVDDVITFNPLFNEDAFAYSFSNVTADLEISVIFSTSQAAIEGIDADNANAPVEYFNLQGMRVNADNLTPGIYVTRQGNKTVKVLVK